MWQGAKKEEQRAPQEQRALLPKAWAKFPIPLLLALEVPGHCDAHPDPPLVAQVQHIMHWFRLPPLLKLVTLDTDTLPVLVKPPPVLNPKPMETRCNFPILLVKVSNPAVQLLDAG